MYKTHRESCAKRRPHVKKRDLEAGTSLHSASQTFGKGPMDCQHVNIQGSCSFLPRVRASRCEKSKMVQVRVMTQMLTVPQGLKPIAGLLPDVCHLGHSGHLLFGGRFCKHGTSSHLPTLQTLEAQIASSKRQPCVKNTDVNHQLLIPHWLPAKTQGLLSLKLRAIDAQTAFTNYKISKHLHP